MSSDRITTKVKEILLDLLDLSDDEIDLSATFIDGLGASSVDLVEMLAALENEFDIDIPDADADRLRTPQDVIDYVERAAS